MDKKSIIGLVLISAILVVWGVFFAGPSEEEIRRSEEAKKQYLDSLARVERADSLKKVAALTTDTLSTDSIAPIVGDSTSVARVDSIREVQKQATFGPFAAIANGTPATFSVENDFLKLTFANKGGQLVSAKLKGYQTYAQKYVLKNNDTLDLFLANQNVYNLTLYSGNREINTRDLFFDVQVSKPSVTGDEIATVTMKAYANGTKNQFVAFIYRIKGNSYLMDFDVQFAGMDKVFDPNSTFIPFEWTSRTPRQELDIAKERMANTIFYKELEGDVDKLGQGGDAEKLETAQIQWFSFKQQYFSSVLYAQEGFSKPLEVTYAQPEGDSSFASEFAAELNIPFDYTPDESYKMQMYLGPNHYNTLQAYNLGLEDQIDLGYFAILRWVNKYLVIPVFNFFDNMQLSYGLIILLLTIIIKLILSPITYKTFVSSAKMRILKPDVDEISKKFKPEEAMKKQQAVMALYRKAGVNPLAGCIPALLQMPILFAMFSFFPAAIELRQQSFLWAQDLSTYDSIIGLPFTIPFYGNHVSLFTLLMTATTMIYTWMSSAQMNTGGASAAQMKIMMFMMPILFLGILNSYPAALSYYYFLSNVISIGLTLLIRYYFVDEEKLRVKIEANKNRAPSEIKKSKFQQRIEAMQKAQEQKLKEKRKK